MRRLAFLLVSLVVPVVFIAPPAGFALPPASNHLVITTLSTGADRVSGGDVLVRVEVPGGVPLNDVRVERNGTDVTGVFRPDASGHALIGLVTGLNDGTNVLTATTKRTKPSLNARLAVQNFPILGPIFSGPHAQRSMSLEKRVANSARSLSDSELEFASEPAWISVSHSKARC